MKLNILFRGMSDPGMKRRNNEDSYLINDNLMFAMVADGMGGHNAGEVASAMATEVTNTKFQILVKNGTVPPVVKPGFTLKSNQLAHSIELASMAIYDASLVSGKKGMGTTATSVMLEGENLYFAHVGDSRAYLIRNGVIAQVTEDHSFVMESVRKGLMTLEQAEASPLKNIITRALGSEDVPEVDLIKCQALPGDRVVLCTDGLNKCVTDEELLKIVSSTDDNLDSCDDLIEFGNKHGGPDNITVVIGTVYEEQ
ncbi:MAG: serine/threonine-protein phosphatase [Elusimicrobiales bacterium]|nr:serine/threonine-protein phosphatase [Elusimicrobiales bacterium]